MKRDDHESIVNSEIEHQTQILFPYDEGRTGRLHVERALHAVARRAFEEGRAYALTSLLTVDDLAAEFRVSPRRVRALAQVAHDRYGTGWQTPRGEWLFTPEEVEILRPGPPGRRRADGEPNVKTPSATTK